MDASCSYCTSDLLLVCARVPILLVRVRVFLCAHSGHFVDQSLEAVAKIGFGIVDFVRSLQPRPHKPFPKGHPRHGGCVIM